MAFRWVGNRHGTTPQVHAFYMTDSETAVAGRLFKFSSQRMTKEGNGGTTPDALCIEDVNAGTDVEADFILLDSADILEANYVGTADSAFVKGQQTADLDTSADNLLASDVTTGCMFILSVDTTNLVARCIPRKNTFIT